MSVGAMIESLDRQVGALLNDLARYLDPWTVERYDVCNEVWESAICDAPLTEQNARERALMLAASNLNEQYRVIPWFTLNQWQEMCRGTQVLEQKLAEANQQITDVRVELEQARTWIKAANQFSWAHERDCPSRLSGGSKCTCGLDEFLGRPRAFVESYKSRLAVLEEKLNREQRQHEESIRQRDIAEDSFTRLAALFGVETEFSNQRGFEEIIQECSRKAADDQK